MITPAWKVPEGWTAIPRAISETRRFPDGLVHHVIAWEVTRDACGCEIVLGMRMDREEPTSGMFACDDHEQECMLVINALQTMEPQETELVTLAAGMLDEAVKE